MTNTDLISVGEPATFATDGTKSSSSTSNTSNISVVTNKDDNGGEMHYGDRLLDDLMNTFCDRLQKVSPQKYDGMLAIQFVMMDPSQVRTMINGTKDVHQIMYDSEREHYVAVQYQANKKRVLIYDSLNSHPVNSQATTPIKQQLLALFGHLSRDGSVHLAVSTDYGQQRFQCDNWSCGYRAIACMVDLARGREPAHQNYDIKAIFDFLNVVLATENVEWKLFLDSELGTEIEEPPAVTHFTSATLLNDMTLVHNGSTRSRSPTTSPSCSVSMIRTPRTSHSAMQSTSSESRQARCRDFTSDTLTSTARSKSANSVQRSNRSDHHSPAPLTCTTTLSSRTRTITTTATTTTSRSRLTKIQRQDTLRQSLGSVLTSANVCEKWAAYCVQSAIITARTAT